MNDIDFLGGQRVFLCKTLKVQAANFHMLLVGTSEPFCKGPGGFGPTCGEQPRTIRKILVVDDNIALTFAGSKPATFKRVTQQQMHRRSECRCQGAGEQDESGMPVVSPECRGPWDCIAETRWKWTYTYFSACQREIKTLGL